MPVTNNEMEHPINRLLYHVGLRVSRARGLFRLPPAFATTYRRNLTLLRRDGHGFEVFRELQYDVGTHPETYVDYECTFAAQQIGRLRPRSILDIGSYRHFVLGLLSHFEVTTIDIRNRQSISDNETVITCDAKKLPLSDGSFDAVISMCAVEHFGLGRYGDEFELDGDRQGVREMLRVLKPKGHLILTTTITRSSPAIAFNAHRIYNYEMLRQLFSGLNCVAENFYSSTLRRYCSFDEVTTTPKTWDVYCGCWEKADTGTEH